MATFEKRVSADGEVSWRVKIRVKGHAPVNKTFKTQTLAKKWAKKTETDIEEGRYFPSAQSKGRTLSDLIEAYLKSVKIDNPRRMNELGPIMSWWEQEYGYKLLQECRGEMFIEAQQKLAQKNTSKKDKDGKSVPLSVATVNRYMVALNTALNFSVKNLHWLPSNPMAGVKKLKEPIGRTRFLSDEEINRLMDACLNDESIHIFAAVLLGISTGRRKSALLQLKWEDVDLDTGRIRFWESKTQSYVLSTISGPTLELLKRKHGEKDTSQRLVFPSAIKSGSSVDIRKAWLRVLKKAQIENFRFHDLRHTCASYLAMNGASLMEVASVLGHKTLTMVKRYAHFAEDHTASIQKKMNSKLLGHVKI